MLVKNISIDNKLASFCASLPEAFRFTRPSYQTSRLNNSSVYQKLNYFSTSIKDRLSINQILYCLLVFLHFFVILNNQLKKVNRIFLLIMRNKTPCLLPKLIKKCSYFLINNTIKNLKSRFS